MILPRGGSRESGDGAHAPARGTVYLVGAGPGDPDLLTVAAARLLRRANVVIHDALIGEAILDLISPDARQIDVGKRCGGRRTSQERINELLVESAESARIVVRLKGGDPFVFGRGGEEALALSAAGVRYRVVPGVTAGVGVSAYAGIPVTHRGLASSVTFVTGHEDVGRSQNRVDWEALAQVGGTLVVYMGVGSLGSVAEKLIEAGKPTTTPAAIIEWGTYGRQRTVTASLAALPQAAQDDEISSPALVVIGEVASLRERLDWFERLPLRGKRILVARSRPQPSRIARSLTRLGAEVTEFPKLVAVPVPLTAESGARIDRIGDYGWSIFTSPAGVRHFWRELASRGLDARALAGLRLAAFGLATSKALRSRGIVADVEARTFKTDVVAELLGGAEGLRGARILFPRERDLTSPIAQSLRRHGAVVDELVVFAAAIKPTAPGLMENADVIVLPSSSSAREVAKELSGRSPRGRIVAIGPSTAQTALDCGLIVDSVAADHSVRGVAAAVRESLGVDDTEADATWAELVVATTTE